MTSEQHPLIFLLRQLELYADLPEEGIASWCLHCPIA
jgi:hypothetical protein